MRRALLAVLLLAAVAHAEEKDTVVFGPGWKEPQVAVAPNGATFVVAAKDGAIAVASVDSRSAGSPVTMATVEKLMCGMRRGPRIAATEKALVVTAISAATGDLSAWRSADQGATWQGPVRVNGQEKAAREGLHGLAAGAKGELAVAWLDDRKGGKEVWAATSTDGGATWKEGLVYASPDGHVCECCHPSVAFNAKGELAVMWRNWLDGSRDFWFASSKDLGKKWSKAEKLGGGTWRFNQCPMDGGALAGRPEGGFVSIWRRDKEVFVTLGKPAEQLLGAGKQGWIAAGPGGVYAVWLDGSDLLALTPQAKRATRIAEGATDPCVAGPLDAKGPVVAVWQADDGVHSKVVAVHK